MITRKVLTVVLSLMLAAAALLGFTKTVRADGETFKFKGEDGQTLTYKVLSTADKTVEVSDGKMVPGEVVIPEKVKDAEGNEYTVVRVGKEAFDMYGDYWSNKTLTHITIPGTVKSIGARAFRYGWALGVTLSEGLEVIEDEAFLNCSAFGQIELPQSLKSIGDKAFYKCFSLTSVTIPESTTSIVGNAFT